MSSDGRRTTASLLAFDQATGECLKLKRGMVVAVLNPSSIKSKMPHQRHGIALVAARKKQVVILGLAEYFGFCSAVDSRSAKECGSWIDKRFGKPFRVEFIYICTSSPAVLLPFFWTVSEPLC